MYFFLIFVKLVKLKCLLQNYRQKLIFTSRTIICAIFSLAHLFLSKVLKVEWVHEKILKVVWQPCIQQVHNVLVTLTSDWLLLFLQCIQTGKAGKWPFLLIL